MGIRYKGNLRRRAIQGDAAAQNTLGEYYALGKEGMPLDIDEAVKWFRLAAESGSVEAGVNLERILKGRS